MVQPRLALRHHALVEKSTAPTPRVLLTASCAAVSASNKRKQARSGCHPLPRSRLWSSRRLRRAAECLEFVSGRLCTTDTLVLRNVGGALKPPLNWMRRLDLGAFGCESPLMRPQINHAHRQLQVPAMGQRRGMTWIESIARQWGAGNIEALQWPRSSPATPMSPKVPRGSGSTRCRNSRSRLVATGALPCGWRQ